MSLQSLTNDLQGTIDRWIADRERITTNGDYTYEAAQRQLADVRGLAFGNAARIVDELWGAVVRTGDGQQTLDPNGVVWRELRIVQNALHLARQTAEQTGIDPAFIQHGEIRARALIAQAGARHWDFIDAYRGSSAHVRAALQDGAFELLNDKIGMEWDHIRQELERDRLARVNTPAVVSAQAAVSATLLAVDAAYSQTKRAADQLVGAYLGSGTFASREAIAETLSLIGREMRMLPPTEIDPEGAIELRFEAKVAGFVNTSRVRVFGG